MKTTAELKEENRVLRAKLKQGAEARLRAIPGVVHVSVGLRQKEGLATDELCVRVYVRKKRTNAEVSPTERVPALVDGLPTDVNEVGAFSFAMDNARYRPAQGGIQITNKIIGLNAAGTGTAMSRGTLGCFALDNTDNSPVLITNAHILLANTGREGDRIYQPAPVSLPATALGDLPLRPTSDEDKIGVLRRTVMSANVDGAVGLLDVSSCCHCCGIRYSNAIGGLSVGGRPSRNTIVGDEAAVSGMTVFKMGQATGRSEGRVVEDNYPPFSITRDGVTHTFSGQICIQNADATQPFSAHGDSGSVVVNQDNKIVGLLFADGRNADLHGAPQPFLSQANHIAHVLSELNIRIPYSAEVVVNAGEAVAGAPLVFEAAIPEAYQRLRERMLRHPSTAAMLAAGQRHADEVRFLVNHRRAVTVAWHRSQGPALLALLMGAIRDGHERLPAAVRGVTPARALENMRKVLGEQGSAELCSTLRTHEADLLLELSGTCRSVGELFERAASSTGEARTEELRP
jgi:hypothetical protein